MKTGHMATVRPASCAPWSCVGPRANALESSSPHARRVAAPINSDRSPPFVTLSVDSTPACTSASAALPEWPQ